MFTCGILCTPSPTPALPCTVRRSLAHASTLNVFAACQSPASEAHFRTFLDLFAALDNTWLTYLPKFTIPCLPHTPQNSCSLCLFLTTIRCPLMVLPRPSILVLPSLPSSIFVPLSHSSSFN